MKPVVVLLPPDLGEHFFDEILVGPGMAFARLFALPAIVRGKVIASFCAEEGILRAVGQSVHPGD